MIFNFNYFKLQNLIDFQDQIISKKIDECYINYFIEELLRYETQYKFNPIDSIYLRNKILLSILYSISGNCDAVSKHHNEFYKYFNYTKILCSEGFSNLKRLISTISYSVQYSSEKNNLFKNEVISWDVFLEKIKNDFFKSGLIPIQNTSIHDRLRKEIEYSFSNRKYSSYMKQENGVSVFVSHNTDVMKNRNRFTKFDFGHVCIYQYDKPILYHPFLENKKIGFNTVSKNSNKLSHEVKNGVHHLQIGRIKRIIDVKENFVCITDEGSGKSIYNFNNVNLNLSDVKTIGKERIELIQEDITRITLNGKIRSVIIPL